MPITTTTRRAGPFAGDGINNIFPFAFQVFGAADLLVTQDGAALALDTDYQVTLSASGGTVSLIAMTDTGPVIRPLHVGATLTIASNMEMLQTLDLTTTGGFYPQTITQALDRLTIYVQQLMDAFVHSQQSDAPMDGKVYGRQNGAWVEVTAGSGTGTIAAVVVAEYAEPGGTATGSYFMPIKLAVSDELAWLSASAPATSGGFMEYATGTDVFTGNYRTLEKYASGEFGWSDALGGMAGTTAIAEYDGYIATGNYFTIQVYDDGTFGWKQITP